MAKGQHNERATNRKTVSKERQNITCLKKRHNESATYIAQ